jgi:hypothetical protein
MKLSTFAELKQSLRAAVLRRYGASIVKKVALAGMLLLAVCLVPEASAAVSRENLPTALATCAAANQTPWQGGSSPSGPGHWTDGQHYGTGWDFIFNGSGSQQTLKAFFFTYSSKGFPIWLSTPTKLLGSDADGSYFESDLQGYTQSASGTITGPSTVGSVAIRFLPTDPSKVAVDWQWFGADSGSTAQQSECLTDIARTAPNCYSTANCASSIAQGPVSDAPNSIGVNQLLSGYWNQLGASDQR